MAHDPKLLSVRILVVEDEPVIAADIKNTLVEAGHRVVGIGYTSDEAFALFLEHKPDVVVMDIQLADGSSGIDAARRMTSVRRIPTIFVTAFPERLLTEKRLDPTYLITKPFQPETLVAALDRVLFGEGPRNLRPAEALRIAAAGALVGVERLTPDQTSENEVGAHGHNGPPAEFALPYGEFMATVDILTRLEKAPAQPPSDVSQYLADKERLAASAAKIASWVAEKVAEGALNKVGENLADVRALIALWLMFSGNLQRVVDALVQYLG